MPIFEELAIDINLFDIKKEPKLYKTVMAFNELYAAKPQNFSEKAFFELYTDYQTTHPANPIPLSLWKIFRIDDRVQTWYDGELKLQLQNNLHKVASKAGTDKSTATQQTLKGLLEYFDADKVNAADNNKIFVYSLIPLNFNEMKNENVRVIKNIPEGIRDAIVISDTTRNTIKK